MSDARPQDILIIEDDRPLAELVVRYMRGRGFECHAAHRGDEGLAEIRRLIPGLVILDLMLPGMDGLAVCREARGFYGGPILILTARDEDVDQILGLELGADDYLVKPVQPRLLLARVRALLRRARPNDPSGADLRVGGIEIRRSERRVFIAGTEVDVTTAEYELLTYLAERAGHVVSREQLFRDLRGVEYDGLDRSMDLRVSRLRGILRQLNPGGDAIHTVRGRGYLLRKADR